MKKRRGFYIATAANAIAFGGMMGAAMGLFINNINKKQHEENAVIKKEEIPEFPDMLKNDPLRIILFYLNLQKTHKDKATWQQVIAYNDKEFETYHHFIQWLFPTPYVSVGNEECPLLNKNIVRVISANRFLVSQFKLSVEYFLKMLGLALESNVDTIAVKVLDSKILFDKIERKKHNNLRITRFMQCCGCMQVPHYAWALYLALLKIQDIKNKVGDSLKYWKNVFRNPFWFVDEIKNNEIKQVQVEIDDEIRYITDMLNWYLVYMLKPNAIATYDFEFTHKFFPLFSNSLKGTREYT